jgi:DNA-binding SARP family transcriptional activator
LAISWRIELLGGLRVEGGGRTVTRFPTQKTAALLGYLAYYRDRAHPREVLTTLLWPEAEREAARHRLNVALSSLRQQLTPPGALTNALFVSDRFTVQLNPAAVTTDVAAFEAAVRAGLNPPAAHGGPPAKRIPCLARAVDLYRGALLPGFYEDWISAEQLRLEALFFEALHPLIALLEQAGDRDRALQYALRGVSVDPLREEPHRELMRLYAAAGQPAAALRQYRDLERKLQQEVGEAPSPATRQLMEGIRSSGLQAFRCFGGSGCHTVTSRHSRRRP